MLPTSKIRLFGQIKLRLLRKAICSYYPCLESRLEAPKYDIVEVFGEHKDWLALNIASIKCAITITRQKRK